MYNIRLEIYLRSENVKKLAKMFFSRCTFTITVPANSPLIIRTLDINLECPYDNLYLAINNDSPFPPLCSTYNTTNITAIESKPAAYTLRVYFASDDSIAKTGFLLKIYVNTTITASATTPRAPGMLSSNISTLLIQMF